MAREKLHVTAEGRERIILAAARNMLSKRESRATPNWVLAMRIFALGSTYACAICETAGINPDGFEASPHVSSSGIGGVDGR